MNSESEKNFIDRKNLGRISLRDRDVAGSKMEETTNKGKSLWVWIILNKLVASLMFTYFLYLMEDICSILWEVVF